MGQLSRAYPVRLHAAIIASREALRDKQQMTEAQQGNGEAAAREPVGNFAWFLQSQPPNKAAVLIEMFEYHRTSTYRLELPEIEIHCETVPTCDGVRVFRPIPAGVDVTEDKPLAICFFELQMLELQNV